MRTAIFVVLLVSASARANTSSHHDVGGGGGGSAQCIRWEPIVYDLGGRDMASVDMALGDGNGDAGAPLDLGPRDMSAHAGEHCVEYASLFSCAMAGGHTDGGAVGVVGLAFVIVLVRRRHRA